MSIFDRYSHISGLHLSYFKICRYRLIPSVEDSRNGLVESFRYLWTDEGIPVARVTTERWKQMDWNSCYDLLIHEPYRGYGLSHDLVEFVKSCGVTHLSVHKDNQIAKRVYEQHGFVITGEETDGLLTMELHR